MKETGDLSFVSSEIQSELESTTLKIEKQIKAVGKATNDVKKDLIILTSQIEFELYNARINLEKLEYRVSRLEKDFEKARKREIITVIVTLFLFSFIMSKLFVR